ncbi:MAG: hypothetical protein V7646_7269 [Pseudonocardia sp.]|jgi:hypothetical protein
MAAPRPARSRNNRPDDQGMLGPIAVITGIAGVTQSGRGLAIAGIVIGSLVTHIAVTVVN